MLADLALAAAESSGGDGWNGTTIAALIAAVGGAFGGIFTGIRSIRSDKFKRNVEAGAALLTGYTDMVAQLRSELDRVKEDHSEDKEAWRVEREALRREFDEDRRRMREQHAEEVRELNDRIDELSSQVYALTHRAGSKSRSTD